MNYVFLLKNPIQEYAWGSKTVIPGLLGQTMPSRAPVAELWMGAHPRDASSVINGHRSISLPELISRDPKIILGVKTAQRFNNTLPFLFKILAAEIPLSIQAHPDKQQAREGFLRENNQQIKPDAYNRTFKDDNHKPEIICALTPFHALNGFLPYNKMIQLFQALAPSFLKTEISVFAAKKDPGAFKIFYKTLLQLDQKSKKQLVDMILQFADKNKMQDPKFQWLLKIHTHFPGNPGIISAALLNLVQLKPGQAMFLPARQLHSYLQGTGIELMANSDNVLRGGLTPKFVNVPELLNILDFRQQKVDIIRPQQGTAGDIFYRTPAEEFLLSRINVSQGRSFHKTNNNSVCIMICIRGEGIIESISGAKPVKFSKGQSWLIAGALKEYTISGQAEIFCAGIP